MTESNNRIFTMTSYERYYFLKSILRDTYGAEGPRQLNSIDSGKQDRYIQNVLSSLPAIRGLVEEMTLFTTEKEVYDIAIGTKNDIYHITPPFSSILIDAQIPVRNGRTLGIFVAGVAEPQGADRLEALVIQTVGLHDDGKAFVCTSVIGKRGETQEVHDFSSFGRVAKSDMKKLSQFVINLFEFIYNPEIEIVRKDADPVQNAKRLKRGKLAHPNSFTVRITGNLRTYVDSIKANSDAHGSHYSYRFKVKAHFRTLRSTRYGKNMGKKIFVAECIKGEGPLFVKSYRIGAGKGRRAKK